MLPQLMRLPRTALVWHRAVPVLHPPNPLARGSCPPPPFLVRGPRWGNPAPALAAGGGGAKLLLHTPCITTTGMVWEEKPGTPLKCTILPPQWECAGTGLWGLDPYHNHWPPSCFCWTVTRHGDAKKWQKCKCTVVLNTMLVWRPMGERWGVTTTQLSPLSEAERSPAKPSPKEHRWMAGKQQQPWSWPPAHESGRNGATGTCKELNPVSGSTTWLRWPRRFWEVCLSLFSVGLGWGAENAIYRSPLTILFGFSTTKGTITILPLSGEATWIKTYRECPPSCFRFQ